MAKKNNKKSGINMEKLNKIDKELGEVMQNVEVRKVEGTKIGSEMVEQQISEEMMEEMSGELRIAEEKRIEDMEEYFAELKRAEEDEKIRKELEDEMNAEIDRAISVESTMKLVKEIDEYTEAKTNQSVLNREIKRALIHYKGKGVRGVMGKQMKAITDGYKRVTGFDMSEEQIMYMRTITDIQAETVIKTIVAYSTYLKNQTRLATNC